VATNPIVAGRLAAGNNRLAGAVVDPGLRASEGAALLVREAVREAHILAFNDVFLVIGSCGALLFLWAVSIEVRMRRRRETPPTLKLVEKMAAASKASNKGVGA
jgi:hypothetical protein